jgi:hypothetical protein
MEAVIESGVSPGRGSDHADDPVHASGGGPRRFVTCGTGFSLVPIRVDASHQVAFLDLVPGG